MNDNLPKDPFMLLSMINMRLRDDYPDLDELCAAMDINKTELTERLKSAGFEYIPSINQFR